MNMLTYNVKLEFPQPAEKARFENTLALQRDCWNFMSAFVYERVPKNDKDFHDLVYYPSREKFPGLSSQYVTKTRMDVKAAYQSIESNEHTITEPPKKTALSVRLDKRLFRMRGNSIFVTACEGKRIEMTFKPYPKLQSLFDTMQSCDPLVFERDGQFWLSISFRPAEKFVVENKVLGVDLGEKRLFATSENQLFVDREFNARKRRIRFLKRNLRACKTKSARKKARKVRRKEANMTKQTVHKAVTLILETSANVIAIENLKGIKKNVFGRNKKKGAFGRKRNNKFSQVPLAQFREVLEYKAGHAGKRVVAVSPANTSKRDYRGLKNGKRKGRRYIGRDGVILDSDVNGAINIAAKCAEKRELPISFGNFRVPGLDGQAVVNQPNVFKSLHVGVLQAPVL